MRTNQLQLLRAFAGRRVLVVGDAVLDTYLHGAASRISREAPVPVVTVSRREDSPGGAANAAANLRTLGGQVRFVSVIGRDAAGRRLRDRLTSVGVPTDDLIEHPARRTATKQRLVADGHVLARFDEGTSEGIDGAALDELLARVQRHVGWADAVLLSDYGGGVLGDATVACLARLRSAIACPLVLDAKEPARFRRLSPTAVKPNYAEAVGLIGEPPLSDVHRRPHQIASAADRLLHACGARLAAVTIDSDGVLLLEHDAPPYRSYARPVDNARAAGAGDTFVAAASLALAAGADGPAAVEIASAAAAVALRQRGTATCRAVDLAEQLSADVRAVLARERVEQQVASYRRAGRRIVFTNGCFDILHRGHVTLLNRAKALGDVLIVGVNTDEGVRRLKGPGRPVNTLEDRSEVLAALSCIDHIVSFAEETPADLIRAIRPDVYVKGGDYSLETLPEASLVAELGGVVQILPLVEDRSTTRIIERIQGPSSDRPVGQDERSSRVRRHPATR